MTPIHPASAVILKALTAANVLPRDGRPMTARELLRAIRLAIAEEQAAVALYQALVDAAGDDAARRIFESIAGEEMVHIGEFERLIEEVDPEAEAKRRAGAREAEDLLDEYVIKAMLPGFEDRFGLIPEKHQVRGKRKTYTQTKWVKPEVTERSIQVPLLSVPQTEQRIEALQTKSKRNLWEITRREIAYSRATPNSKYYPPNVIKIPLSRVGQQAVDLVDYEDWEVPALDPREGVDVPFVSISKQTGRVVIQDGFHRISGMVRWAREHHKPLESIVIQVALVDDQKLIDNFIKPDGEDDDDPEFVEIYNEIWHRASDTYDDLKRHERAVARAVNAGKPVPEEVLKSYPKLKDRASIISKSLSPGAFLRAFILKAVRAKDPGPALPGFQRRPAELRPSGHLHPETRMVRRQTGTHAQTFHVAAPLIPPAHGALEAYAEKEKRRQAAEIQRQEAEARAKAGAEAAEVKAAEEKQPWEMTEKEWRIAENKKRYEAIRAALLSGKQIVIPAMAPMRSKIINDPSIIRFSSAGEIQILRGYKKQVPQWDTIPSASGELASMAAQAGIKILPMEERETYEDVIDAAIEQGKPVPAQIKANREKEKAERAEQQRQDAEDEERDWGSEHVTPSAPVIHPSESPQRHTAADKFSALLSVDGLPEDHKAELKAAYLAGETEKVVEGVSYRLEGTPRRWHAAESKEEAKAKEPPQPVTPPPPVLIPSDVKLSERMDRVYGAMSSGELQKKMLGYEKDLARLHHAAKREFTGMNTRRTGAAVAAEGVHDVGEEKLRLGIYIRARDEASSAPLKHQRELAKAGVAGIIELTIDGVLYRLEGEPPRWHTVDGKVEEKAADPKAKISLPIVSDALEKKEEAERQRQADAAYQQWIDAGNPTPFQMGVKSAMKAPAQDVAYMAFLEKIHPTAKGFIKLTNEWNKGHIAASLSTPIVSEPMDDALNIRAAENAKNYGISELTVDGVLYRLEGEPPRWHKQEDTDLQTRVARKTAAGNFIYSQASKEEREEWDRQGAERLRKTEEGRRQAELTSIEFGAQYGIADDRMINSYDPVNSVYKVGHHWQFKSIFNNPMPGGYDTKREAVAAATRHKQIYIDRYKKLKSMGPKQWLFENPDFARRMGKTKLYIDGREYLLDRENDKWELTEPHALEKALTAPSSRPPAAPLDAYRIRLRAS